MIVASLFLAAICGLATQGVLPPIVAIVYLVASLVAVVAYAIDKSAAQRGQWRTSESTLHLLALLGGWPGALIAQQVFHHKSRKMSFQFLFWTTVAVNCAVLAWYGWTWR
jgi:uncharacterized membrane protein YsdA (DUF1294 family)